MTDTNRRTFLKTLGKTSIAIPLCTLLPGVVIAAAPQVDPQSATAKSLQYTHTTANPEQTCVGCQLYTASDTDGWGNCPIFPGQVVAAEGWCVSWVKKAG